MDVQDVLRDLGLILGAGLLSAPVAAFLRLPVMLVLVGAGALIGPSALGLGESPLDGLGAQLVFTLGVSLILFHGGLQISLRVISQTAVGLGLLVLPGVLITSADRGGCCGTRVFRAVHRRAPARVRSRCD